MFLGQQWNKNFGLLMEIKSLTKIKVKYLKCLRDLIEAPKILQIAIVHVGIARITFVGAITSRLHFYRPNIVQNKLCSAVWG